MSKRLVLHIGTQKTGTTNIQQYLHDNSSCLLDNYDIYYPIFTGIAHNDTFVPIFIKDVYNKNFFKRRDFNKENYEMRQAECKKKWSNIFSNNKCTTTIISAEELTDLTKEEIYYLKDYLEGFFDTIDIIVYLREPIGFIRSLLQQYVKTDFICDSIDIILQKLKNVIVPQKYQNIINWVDTFDNAIVCNFNSGFFYNNSLIEDFFYRSKLMNVNLKNHKKKANQSLGVQAISFLNHYNVKYPSIINNQFNSQRGMNSKYRCAPIEIFEKTKDEKFNMDIFFNKAQSEKLNKYVEFFNSTYTDFDWEHIVIGKKRERFYESNNISTDFYIDLFNEYNKFIEKLLNDKNWLAEQYKFKNKKITEMEEAKKWFKSQVSSRDKRIKELEKYNGELLKAKEWLESSDEQKDESTDTLEGRIELLDKHNQTAQKEIEEKNNIIDELSSFKGFIKYKLWRNK